jgi:hypothetical protein
MGKKNQIKHKANLLKIEIFKQTKKKVYILISHMRLGPCDS